MVNLLKFVFNLFFELKYWLLYYFNSKTEVNSVEIQSVYLIDKNTKKNKILENQKIITKIGNHIFLNNNIENIEDKQNYLIDIGFKWNKKDYRINFELDYKENNIIFPFFNLNDIKKKINNQIIFVEDESDNTGNIEINMERNKLLNIYGGPIGDFYNSKGFGIPLYNLYSLKYNDFLFRDVRLKMEDLFLNEYKINTENQNHIFKFKNNLDDTKINQYNQNEEYILNTYRKFNLDWKNTIIGVFYWIFGKKKNE
jgi:hypothetical protein